MRFLLIALILFVSGCSQQHSLAIYHVSEAQLEQLIKQQLPTLTRQAQVAGIPFKLQIEQMQISIGPDNTDVVRIQTVAAASINLFGLTYPATLSLAVEGAPFYEATEQAVYVRSVKLLDSSIEAAGYRGNLAPLSQELLMLVNQFLNSQPVYRLDNNNPKIRLLTVLPLNMQVQQGRLAFIPAPPVK